MALGTITAIVALGMIAMTVARRFTLFRMGRGEPVYASYA